MKKALSLILALVLCLSLCACGGGDKSNGLSTGAKVDVSKEIVGKWVSTNPDVAQWTIIFYADGVVSRASNLDCDYASYSVSGDNIIVDGWATWEFEYKIVEGVFVLTSGSFTFAKDHSFDATTHTIAPEEEFAAKMLIAAAKHFSNSYEIQVKNVWIDNPFLSDLYFTFELKMIDAQGKSVTSYYGTSGAISGIDSDTEQEWVIRSINDFGTASMYFEKDQTAAMEDGEELYAADVQKYFEENYR